MTTPDSQKFIFSANSYFGTQLPPPTLEDDMAGVRSFVHRQRDLGRKVVLVTVSVTLILCPSAQSPCQERRDNCSFGAQCVSVVLCVLTPYLVLIPPRVRFLDNFSAGGLLPGDATLFGRLT
jgi:hypothetical protein